MSRRADPTTRESLAVRVLSALLVPFVAVWDLGRAVLGAWTDIGARALSLLDRPLTRLSRYMFGAERILRWLVSPFGVLARSVASIARPARRVMHVIGERLSSIARVWNRATEPFRRRWNSARQVMRGLAAPLSSLSRRARAGASELASQVRAAVSRVRR